MGIHELKTLAMELQDASGYEELAVTDICQLESSMTSLQLHQYLASQELFKLIHEMIEFEYEEPTIEIM